MRDYLEKIIADRPFLDRLFDDHDWVEEDGIRVFESAWLCERWAEAFDDGERFRGSARTVGGAS